MCVCGDEWAMNGGECGYEVKSLLKMVIRKQPKVKKRTRERKNEVVTTKAGEGDGERKEQNTKTREKQRSKIGQGDLSTCSLVSSCIMRQICNSRCSTKQEMALPDAITSQLIDRIQ